VPGKYAGGGEDKPPLRAKNISMKGPRNCRSLGFARDDKKERVFVRKERLLEEERLLRRASNRGEGQSLKQRAIAKAEGNR
jgi:hypothetical protein